MGLGWCCLALQPHLLFPARFHKVLHPICSEWESLGPCYRATGMNGLVGLVRHRNLAGGIQSQVNDLCLDVSFFSDCIYKEERFRERRT